MNIDTLKDPSGALITFGKHIGINKEIWAEHEELGKLTYNEPDFDRTKASNLTLDQIVPMVDAYGDALVCRFKVADMTILEIDPDLNIERVEEFLNKANKTSKLTFELRLDKSKLVEKLVDGTPPSCRLFLYLFPEALERFLSCELGRLEKSLWGNDITCKVMILVPNREIWLNGPYLSVLGGEQIESWRNEVPQKPLDIEKVKKMYLTCRENLKWQESWLQHLTPLHIKVEGKALPEDLIANALHVHLVNSIILYTADRTIGNTDKPEFSTYAKATQSVNLTLANPKDQLRKEEKDGVRSLLKMLEWTYEPQWSVDRLPLVQISLVQALYVADQHVRYLLLMNNAANIFDGLQWHWKAFIEGRVDAYMAEVRALEDYIASTSQAFAGQIEAMIKNLSDTMLAAVGVLLGSFIAALFQNSFNKTVFMIGMYVYAGYVLMFPLLYNMIYQWHHYKTIVKEYKTRRRRFEERLYPDKVEDIVGSSITESERNFIICFVVILITYIVVIGLAIYSAKSIPELYGMQLNNSITPGLSAR